MADAWNPAQYDRFAAERRQPFLDLRSLVAIKPAMRVVDLGCGTGETTADLHRHLGAAETLGIDTSEAMLAKCAAFAGNGLRFEKGDLSTFASFKKYDLIFSNAAIHWVGGHPALLGRLAAMLAPGGQLAVQVPANDDHLSHTTAAEVAAEPPFREALGGYVRVSPVLAPEAYATCLDALGFESPHVRLQVYGHRLPSREDVVEWVKGTLLTDYQRRLPSELFERFLARYREVLFPRLADTRPFFYPYKRILFHAVHATSKDS